MGKRRDRGWGRKGIEEMGNEEEEEDKRREGKV